MSGKLGVRPRGMALLLLAATLLAGMVLGVALDRLLLRPDPADAAYERDQRDRPTRVGDIRGLPEERRAFRGRYLERVAEELELTTEQRESLDSLLAAQQERTRAVMREVQPRLREVVRETRQEMEAILTPEQRERLRELRPAERGPGGREGERPRRPRRR